MDPFDSALDLLRRLPPRKTAQNLTSLTHLAPSLTEDLLASVDAPLQIRICPSTSRPYLLCDYNRDGDSYRSPWSNTFDPPIPEGEATLPSKRVRDLEVRINDAMEIYRELYYEGPSAISSAYLWEYESTLAGVILFQNRLGEAGDQEDGGWDSIHVFETTTRARMAHYKLTSTVILTLGSKGRGDEVDAVKGKKRREDELMSHRDDMDLSGYMTRQVESDMAFKDDGDHIINVGRLVEDMELRMRNLLQEVYFGKVKDIVGDLRSIEPNEILERYRSGHRDMLNSMSR